MHIEQLQQNFERRRKTKGLRATLRPGASDDAFDATEARIGTNFPEKVREFYSQHNGLTVEDPSFVILPLEDLTIDEQSHVHFATADGTNRICFDCSRLNQAEQWDIVEPETGTHITLSMASFWTNKMWKWIDRRLAFWRGEV